MNKEEHSFYSMSYEGFLRAILGYRNKRIEEERWMRRQTYYILKAWSDKLPPAHKLWPIAKDDEILMAPIPDKLLKKLKRLNQK